ncbi:MAG: hypothetical protein PHP01_04140 [Phycisphaerae bacterium]|nr:hypothetical protein [Phycisphaerae bacterium]
MKKVRFVFAICFYTIVMLISYPLLGIVFCEPILSVCDILFCGNWIKTTFMYILHGASICFVSFILGIFLYSTPQAIFIAATISIGINWYEAIVETIFISQLGGSAIYLSIVVASIPYLFMLIVIPLVSKWLCANGGKFRERAKKNFLSKQ